MSELREQLGKITDVRIGACGRDDCMFGVHFTFEMGGVGSVQTQVIACSLSNREPVVLCEGLENIRNSKAKFVDFLVGLLKDAKKEDVMHLKGVPVCVTLQGNVFSSFRILTEVI